MTNNNNKKYNFNHLIDRKGFSRKYDDQIQVFGADPLYPMWIADMDFYISDAINQTLQNRCKHKIFGYPNTSNLKFEKSVQHWFDKQYDMVVNPSDVTYFPGVVTALLNTVITLSDKDDKIVVMPPIYPPFLKLANTLGRKGCICPLKMDKDTLRYNIDYELLEDVFKSGNVKLLLFCSPQNPSGRAWSYDELNRLIELSLKYNVILVSDEVHADMPLFDTKHIPILKAHPKAHQCSILCSSPSKTFNLAGLFPSYMITPNPEIKNAFKKTTFAFDKNLFAIEAIHAAYHDSDDWHKEMIEYLEGNVTFLIEFINNYIPEIKVMKPDSSFLAWLDCRLLDFKNGDDLSNFFIKHANIATSNGSTFGGIKYAQFQRINLGCSRVLLSDALESLKEAVYKHIK